jgi:phosphohistidine phosphatase
MKPKRLSLLRHAKAEPGEAAMADRDRPLAARGLRDADAMGTVLADTPPDLVLCSPARRTRETLAVVLEHVKKKPRVKLLEELYSDAGATYVETIAEAAGDAAHVLVVGHNPTIHATAVALTGHGDATQRIALATRFPTGGLATLTVPLSDWHDLRPGAGTLASLVTPGDLAEK